MMSGLNPSERASRPTSLHLASWRKKLPMSYLTPAVVLLATVVMTVWEWRNAVTSAREIGRLGFQKQAESIRNRIQDRISDSEYVLLGGAGLFAAYPTMSRQEWKNYVTALRPEEKLAGFQGVGFTLRVRSADLAAHLAAVRAEGFPDYDIRPDQPRADYHSIIYLEPFTGRNLRAFGYDMHTEAVRRQAMDQACETGQAVMSGPVTLVQEIPGQAMQLGFLIYVPVYTRGQPIADAEARRAALHGFVYSPFRWGDFMDPIVFTERNDVQVEIFSGASTEPGNRVYDSSGSPRAAKLPAGFVPEYCESVQVTHLGRLWTLQFKSLTAFERNQAHSAASLTLGLGLAISLLASGMVFSQSKVARVSNELRQAKVKLEQRVKERTAELSRVNSRLEEDIAARRKVEAMLRQREEQVRLALAGADLGTWDWDVPSGAVTFNARWAEILGRRLDEVDAHVRSWEALVHPEDMPRIKEALTAHLEGRTHSYETEHRMQHKSGEWVWVLDKGRVTERDEQGRPLRVCGTHLDITGRIHEQRRIRELLDQTERDARTKGELLREVNHRVTNNLTSVLGLLVHEAEQLAAGERDHVAPVLDRLQQRLRSLLQVHQLLSRSAWAPVSLEKLAGEIIRGAVSVFPGLSPDFLAVQVGELRVSPRQAGSLALILNELATNTVKHARGEVARIAIRLSAERAGEWITLIYCDNGGGFPAEVLENRRSNVGLKLISEIVTNTLRGGVRLANAGGATTTIRIRVEEENRT